mmetsp:Transcript_20754/g.38623  ORF Transcript_20754/g.38623 Transcript_20754/m.38623 type:complete len:299 (-) Transcript_20754:134-1030(-)
MAKERSGCCRQCSRCYLVTMNIFMMLAGLALVSLSAWLGYNHAGYGEMIENVYVWAPLGCGLGLVFMALLGCCGAISGSRAALALYTVFCGLMLLGAVVLGTFLLIELRAVRTAADDTNANEIVDPAVLQVVNFESVLFNKCCANRSAEPVEITRCPCENELRCVCYHNQAAYDLLFENLESEVCLELESFPVMMEDGEVMLVGDPDEGGCGGGNPKHFQEVLSAFTTEKLLPGAWGILGTGLVLLLGLIFGCYMSCMRHRPAEGGYTEAGDRYESDFEVDRPKEVELQDTSEKMTVA